ncbi:GNAT family N-acetyltransferase [Paeniroseomonas aquatica]
MASENNNLPALRCLTVSSFDDMQIHLAAWDQLALTAKQDIPILFPGWVDAFFRYRLTPCQRWFCSFAYNGHDLLGVLPIIVTPHRFLGEHGAILRTPFDGPTTPSGDILLSPDHAGPVLRALLSEIRVQVPAHLGIDFYRVRQNSPLWGALKNAAPAYIAIHGVAHVHHLVDLTKGYDAYFAGLGNLRRNLKRYRKRLDDKGKVSLLLGEASIFSEDMPEQFFRLEASGWKGREKSAIATDASQVAFYKALFNNFAEKGRLEWHTLTIEGRLIAAGMGLRGREALMLPKIAFDEEFADCAPGTLLTEAVNKDAYSRVQLREINYMSDAAWHRNWHMEEDTYQDLHLVRVGLLPALLKLTSVLFHRAETSARRRFPLSVKTKYRTLRSMLQDRLSRRFR